MIYRFCIQIAFKSRTVGDKILEFLFNLRIAQKLMPKTGQRQIHKRLIVTKYSGDLHESFVVFVRYAE